MIQSAPGAPLPGVPIRDETETVPTAANPTTNCFKNALHGFIFKSRNKYQDGDLVEAQVIIPLDVTTDPMTYTMPCRILGSDPDRFKSAVANAIGSTALWTPAAGKKFRVLGYTFTLPSTATSVAGTVITLKDGVTTIFTLIAMGATTGALTGNVRLNGNGYLSSAADNVLNIDLSAALTVGQIAVSVWGTEE